MPEEGKANKKDSSLAKIDKDGTKLSVEVMQALITEVTKDTVFNFKKKDWALGMKKKAREIFHLK